jgi:hypothetical protein
VRWRSAPALIAALGQDNAAKRLRGWPEAGRTIITIASSAPFTAILSDDRDDMASLYYYTRERSIPLRMWPSMHPANEYEARHALSADKASYVLFVSRKKDVSTVTGAFTSSERIGTIETRLDPKAHAHFLSPCPHRTCDCGNFSIFFRSSVYGRNDAQRKSSFRDSKASESVRAEQRKCYASSRTQMSCTCHE